MVAGDHAGASGGAVGLAIDGAVAVITIDRPQARNAVDPEVSHGIEAALDRIEGDPDLRVGILTGSPPVFSAGADLRVVGAGRTAELSTARGGFAGLVRRERQKPLIAAVDGPALAGGLEIVLACDLVVASTAAWFALPEVQRGLVPAAGGLFRLRERIPPALALEAVIAASTISVEDAARHGLVNRVCAPGEALDVGRALAQEIASNAPVAVRAALAAMRPAATDDAGGWARTAQAEALATASDDVAEGVEAFLERREPRWGSGGQSTTSAAGQRA